jgi:hypothetical protein
VQAKLVQRLVLRFPRDAIPPPAQAADGLVTPMQLLMVRHVGHTTRAVLDAVCKVSGITAVWIEVGASQFLSIPSVHQLQSHRLYWLIDVVFNIHGNAQDAAAANGRAVSTEPAEPALGDDDVIGAAPVPSVLVPGTPPPSQAASPPQSQPTPVDEVCVASFKGDVVNSNIGKARNSAVSFQDVLEETVSKHWPIR